ncbi:unnamed protein product [Aphanomyces euteiches]
MADLDNKMSTERRVNLVSSEGEVYEVSYEVALMSGLVHEQLEQSPNEQHEISLPQVKRCILAKVVEFIKYHEKNPMKKIPRPIKVRFENVVSPWDLNFLRMPHFLLWELMVAARDLDIESLFDLTCAKAAMDTFGMSKEEISQMYAPPQIVTPEQGLHLRLQD